MGRDGTGVDELGRQDPTTVAGYRLLARLGEGGMGRVFLARSPAGAPVALKLIRPEVAGDVEFRSRFAREVAAARRLDGLPGAAAVLDADPEHAQPWLASTYVSGLSQTESVLAFGPLPEASVRALGRGLAAALAGIHQRGLTHRDLKPSNIMLGADGPTIIDFGIARAADASFLTRTGLLVGSPGFMAPEQAEGAAIGPGTDVFALGAVLVHALTGAGPYGEGPAAALLYRVVNSRPNLAGVPEGLRGSTTVRTSSAAGETTTSHAASSTPAAASCTFASPGTSDSCTSSNSRAIVEQYNANDTSACTFTFTLASGDGSSQNVTVKGSSGSSPIFLGSHSYGATGTYTINSTADSVTGSCIAFSFQYTFTYD